MPRSPTDDYVTTVSQPSSARCDGLRQWLAVVARMMPSSGRLAPILGRASRPPPTHGMLLLLLLLLPLRYCPTCHYGAITVQPHLPLRTHIQPLYAQPPLPQLLPPQLLLLLLLLLPLLLPPDHPTQGGLQKISPRSSSRCRSRCHRYCRSRCRRHCRCRTLITQNCCCCCCDPWGILIRPCSSGHT